MRGRKAGRTLFLGQVGILWSSVGMVLYLVSSASWIYHDGFERAVQSQRQHKPTTAWSVVKLDAAKASHRAYQLRPGATDLPASASGRAAPCAPYAAPAPGTGGSNQMCPDSSQQRMPLDVQCSRCQVMTLGAAEALGG